MREHGLPALPRVHDGFTTTRTMPVPDPDARPPAADPAACDREPIHVPGAIQPHGILLALGEPGLKIRQCSANLPALLGCEAAQALGRPLGAVLGAEAAGKVRAALEEMQSPQDVQALQLRILCGDALGLLHRHQGVVLLEIEPTLPPREVALPLGRALRRIQTATSFAALSDIAVQEIRTLTGFDRVMLYRFDADDHGEVVAESRAATLEPFLGLHYPASDIPRQARELYRLNDLRLIPDAAYEPVALVPPLCPDTGQALDLSFSILRSVSPVHREYLANLGVCASMSISILPQDRLWGLVSCGHGAPLRVGYEVRTACQTLGRLLSLKIAAFEEIESRRVREAKSALLERLLEGMRRGDGDVLECLAEHPGELLELAGASGAAIVFSERMQTVGECPSVGLIRALLRWVEHRAQPTGLFQTFELGTEFPDAAGELERGCGLLAMTLPRPECNAVLWFRPERVHTVNWGGNPHKVVEIDNEAGVPRLHPRRSFLRWQEAVRGQAQRWLPGETQAVADLRRYAIEIDLARQVVRERQAVLARDQLVETAAQLTRSLEVANAELQRIAYRDPLTGLSNRLVLEDRIAQVCAHCDRQGESAALLFIDLDGFKPVNDAWGHRAGDLVLKEVAARLRRLVRKCDTVARLGGDEFVVLMEVGGHEQAAGWLAQRVIDALMQPMVAGEREMQLSCSIGIALYPQEQPQAQLLLTQADAAMYAAKRAGRGTYRFYDSRMDSGPREMAELARELRVAMQQGEFELFYQPKVRCETGQVSGVEALARWNHAHWGLMTPDRFIPAIERYGLVSSFSTWVLRAAVAQLRDWRAQGLDLTVAVNLSVHQLRLDGLFELVQQQLHEQGVEAAQLLIEITESAMMEDVEEHLPLLERLSALGVRISIDDFGTGYSSLNYLRRLPVHQLKIDRSFVQDMARSKDARTLVNIIIQLARTQDLDVVAEGVESRQQYEIVKAMGCPQAQGYLFAKPLRADAFLQWLREREPPPSDLAS